jgi:hypothetical protein
MKNNNRVEIVLFSNYSCNDVYQKQLIRWLGTTAQPVIDGQFLNAKKLHVKALKDMPPIYMS